MDQRRVRAPLVRRELVDQETELIKLPEEDQRWFAEEDERRYALPATVDNGDVECEVCGKVHEADVECDGDD